MSVVCFMQLMIFRLAQSSSSFRARNHKRTKPESTQTGRRNVTISQRRDENNRWHATDNHDAANNLTMFRVHDDDSPMSFLWRPRLDERQGQRSNCEIVVTDVPDGHGLGAGLGYACVYERFAVIFNCWAENLMICSVHRMNLICVPASHVKLAVHALLATHFVFHSIFMPFWPQNFSSPSGKNK